MWSCRAFPICQGHDRKVHWQDWPHPITLVMEKAAREAEAFQAADLALAASGTVVMELAALGVPAVVGYKVHPLEAPGWRAGWSG